VTETDTSPAFSFFTCSWDPKIELIDQISEITKMIYWWGQLFCGQSAAASKRGFCNLMTTAWNKFSADHDLMPKITPRSTILFREQPDHDKLTICTDNIQALIIFIFFYILITMAARRLNDFGIQDGSGISKPEWRHVRSVVSN